MWQRFTERARRVVFFAQEEAGRLGENYVSTEHLLLGLVRENDCRAARALHRIGVSLGRIRSEIERQVARGDGRTAQDMQLTPRAKRVIDLAYDEARQLNNNYIGTEHLLLGLIREGEGLAGRVLNKLGVILESARDTVVAVQEEDQSGEGAAAAAPVRPKVGDLGVLKASDGRAAVEVAQDGTAFIELAAAFAAKDAHGYRELRDKGLFFRVPSGTPAKRLDFPDDVSRFASRFAGLTVRILEGEFAGRTGWVSLGSFERTGPDEAPFPPEEQ